MPWVGVARKGGGRRDQRYLCVCVCVCVLTETLGEESGRKVSSAPNNLQRERERERTSMAESSRRAASRQTDGLDQRCDAVRRGAVRCGTIPLGRARETTKCERASVRACECMGVCVCVWRLECHPADYTTRLVSVVAQEFAGLWVAVCWLKWS